MEDHKLSSAQPMSPDHSEFENLKVESPTQSLNLYSPE